MVVRIFYSFIVVDCSDHLVEIPVDKFRDALDSVEGKKPIQRLFAAIASKTGRAQTELAERYDVQRRPISRRLERLVGLESPASAVTNILPV